MAIDREKVLVAAQKYVEKKKYDKAVAEYQKVIQEDPNDARTLLKVGDLQSKMEAYGDAVATYEKVGKFYASQGFALKAIAVYKQIREIIAKHVPQLEERYGHITPKLAELYQQLGLTSDALAALDEVATRLQRQNRDPEAIDVFRKIVELDPTNPLPHLRLAEALSRIKQTDGAVEQFGLAARQLTKLGRRDDAIKVLERLLHHKPDTVASRGCAELYLARNSPNDGMLALAKLQVCFQANPRDFDTLALLSKAFNQIGQAAKGIEVQKEMARIARDTGKLEVFRELVTKLQKLAPNDEGVKRLAAGSIAPPPKASELPPPPAARTSSMVDPGRQPSREDAYEVSEGDLEPEEPIELSRRSRHPVEDGDDGDVVVESSIEVAEEVGETPGVESQPSEQVAGILADAASFRRAHLHGKAVETLRIGLEIDPRSIEIYETLRDVLVEAGDTDQATSVMLALAGLQVDSLDGEAAARTLQELLELEPDNERATEMLRELGYELVEEPSNTSIQTGIDKLPPMRGEYASASSYDPEAPLPSYDLEEIGPEDVALRSYSEPSVRTAPAAQRSALIDDMDDPFGEAPLPSYPLEAPQSEAAFDLVPDVTDITDAGQSDPDMGGATQISQPPTPELESALEEVDFFTSRGLFDDARTIIQEQLARLPKHPLLIERLAEINAQERGLQNGSGTRPSPASVEDRAFDIAESLRELDDDDRTSGVGPGPVFAAADDQVDVEEVFAKFKEGVARQIGADDAQSHYDLGVAYKEMGLVEDAIREFDTAATDPKRACICHSMIGTIQLERGNLNEAIDAFMRGLQAPDRTKEQESALAYEIGAAYEVKRMSKQALDYFQRAARLSPTFRDVQDRVRKLQKATEPKPSARAVAVGADDEFDRAFDDILGDGKIP